MKKAAIIYIIIFLLTALIPLYSFSKDREKDKNSELVTIFSCVTVSEQGYNPPLLL